MLLVIFAFFSCGIFTSSISGVVPLRLPKSAALPCSCMPWVNHFFVHQPLLLSRSFSWECVATGLFLHGLIYRSRQDASRPAFLEFASLSLSLSLSQIDVMMVLLFPSLLDVVHTSF